MSIATTATAYSEMRPREAVPAERLNMCSIGTNRSSRSGWNIGRIIVMSSIRLLLNQLHRLGARYSEMA